jgi:uncharacterized ion transporter superfamily protein YfcC
MKALRVILALFILTLQIATLCIWCKVIQNNRETTAILKRTKQDYEEAKQDFDKATEIYKRIETEHGN